MASSFVKSKFSSTINLTNLILLPLMTTLVKPISILFKFYEDIWDFMAYLIMMVAISYFCMVDRVGVRFFETNVADVIGIMVAVHAGIWVTVSAGLIFNFMG